MHLRNAVPGSEDLLKPMSARPGVATCVRAALSSPVRCVVLQDAAGNTHLHNAVSGQEDLPGLVAALLAVELPANAVNSNGDTALHMAARAGHVEVRSPGSRWQHIP